VFNIGPLELIVVLIIALIVLGPARLPEVARSVGRGLREFRGALSMEDDEDEVHDHVVEPEPPVAPSQAEKPATAPPAAPQAEPAAEASHPKPPAAN
jgi:sec-independent protein translocase protein TatA